MVSSGNMVRAADKDSGLPLWVVLDFDPTAGEEGGRLRFATTDHADLPDTMPRTPIAG